MTTEATCPYSVNTGSKLNREGTYNTDWWPNHLDLSVLRQNSPVSDPMGEKFDYLLVPELPTGGFQGLPISQTGISDHLPLSAEIFD